MEPSVSIYVLAHRSSYTAKGFALLSTQGVNSQPVGTEAEFTLLSDLIPPFCKMNTWEALQLSPFDFVTKLHH